MRIRKGSLGMLSFIVGLMTLAAFAVAPNEAAACSCAEPPPVAEDLQRKTAVFSGKVLDMQGPGNRRVQSSADPVHVLFEVEEAWKGVETTQVVVSTARHGESCGYTGFEVGRSYLVYAYGEPESLRTGICERTKSIERAAEDLAALGPGIVPAKQATLRLDGGGGGGWMERGAKLLVPAAIVASVTLLGLSGAFVYYLARSRARRDGE